jgi:hypothetical protein
MQIELVKNPHDYRKFYHVLKYSKKYSNDDAVLFGSKVCSELKEKTTVNWHVATCVGGKCTIETKTIMNRDKRKKLKGKIIEISSDFIFK